MVDCQIKFFIDTIDYGVMVDCQIKFFIEPRESWPLWKSQNYIMEWVRSPSLEI